MKKLILLLVLLAAPSWATQYFVDPAGDNSDGLSPATAWQTLAAGETGASDADDIQVATATYTEATIFTPVKAVDWTTDGGVVTVITIVGQNSAITLSGAKVRTLTGFTFDNPTTAGTHIVNISGANSNTEFINCVITSTGTAVDALVTPDSAVAMSVTFTTCTFSGSLVGLADLPASPSGALVLAGGTISASFTAAIFDIVGDHSLSVTNMTVTPTGSVTQVIMMDRAAKTGAVVFTGNTVTLTTVVTAQMIEITRGVHDIRIEDNTITSSHASHVQPIIYIRNQTGTRIIGNSITSAGTGDIYHIQVFADDAVNMPGIVISGNTLRTHSVGGYGIFVGTESTTAFDNNIDGAIIENNVILGPGWFGETPTGIHMIQFGFNVKGHIRNNYIHGGFFGIVTKADVTVGDWENAGGIYGNTMVNNVHSGVYIKGAKNVEIHGNTFYTNIVTSAGLLNLGPNAAADDSTGIVARNNIFFSLDGEECINLVDTDQTLTSDNNCFWDDAGTPEFNDAAGATTFAQWQAIYDEHSIAANPVFVNAATWDFRLRKWSPCLNPTNDLRLNINNAPYYTKQFSYGAHDSIYGW